MTRAARYAVIAANGIGPTAAASVQDLLSELRTLPDLTGIAVFGGPQTVAKTSAADIIGEQLDRPVHRSSLAQTVSRYIGETEKNLDRLLNDAASQRALLFFDEVENPFASPPQAAYLLQRIDQFDGVAIISIDDARTIEPTLLRRCRWVIDFNA